MSEQDKIQLFEDQKIRTAWDEERGMIFLCGGCDRRLDGQPQSYRLSEKDA